ncbi:hypothetical protein C8R45DRAFT_1013919 [Mycena sanguinolenta]|nr:hypothetical protein C8R45DRAFT_1013919 [Mycena sanguinolenta]
MRVPPELIDKIISNLDLSQGYDPEIAGALKSCALVARAYVRPCQERLFARISSRDYEDIFGWNRGSCATKLSEKLYLILSHSPHLFQYIRMLDLHLFYHLPKSGAINFTALILSSATALTSLTLQNFFRGRFPVDPSTTSVFSLPSLRSVELCEFRFTNVFELESVLSKATGLKELTLREVVIVEFDALGSVDIEPAVNVKLEVLCLDTLRHRAVTSIVDSFTVVDIRHLRSLAVRDSPVTHLLRANAHSIQTLKIGGSNGTIPWWVDVPDTEVLAGANGLTCIDLEVNDIDSLLAVVPFLGDLRNLTALEAIGIAIHRRLDPVRTFANGQWERLDALLELLPVDTQVHVGVAFDTRLSEACDVAEIKYHLPVLSNREHFYVHL